MPIAITSIRPAARPAAALNAARTRSPLRAAKFCPATGATANPSATTGRNADCTIRRPIVKPPCAAAPNGLVIA